MVIDNCLAVIYNVQLMLSLEWTWHRIKTSDEDEKTSTVSDILAYFMAVPPQCSTKIKRPRDTQVRSHGTSSLKKHEARSHPRPTPELPMFTKDKEESGKEAIGRRTSYRGGRSPYYSYHCFHHVSSDTVIYA
jgi:hypothetical protein